MLLEEWRLRDFITPPPQPPAIPQVGTSPSDSAATCRAAQNAFLGLLRPLVARVGETKCAPPKMPAGGTSWGLGGGGTPTDPVSLYFVCLTFNSPTPGLEIEPSASHILSKWPTAQFIFLALKKLIVDEEVGPLIKCSPDKHEDLALHPTSKAACDPCTGEWRQSRGACWPASLA